MVEGDFSISDLEDIIFNLQARMINLGMIKGLTHPETIKCSQELDTVLNNLQSIKSK
ncbi:aspartyl-phosphate phosphatase Spo0E family protein [Ureibacillus composti]